MTMPLPPPPRDRNGFTTAIICALEVESDAVERLFDHFWDKNGDRYGKAQSDDNSYRTGVIGNHNVVLAYMTGMGKAEAAKVATSCRWSFPRIRLALVVGVCGGVPGSTDGGMFLGDIIISDDIVPYDFGKRYPGTFQRRDTKSRSSGDNEVQAFLRKLRSPQGRENLLDRTDHHLVDLRARTGDYFLPPRRSDQLFEPKYHHKHHESSNCIKCGDNKPCEEAQKATCKELECDRKKMVIRSRSSQGKFNIHFGRIASGDTVMKSGKDRDRIAQKEEVIAFEMEGAGIDGIMPFFVIKGVCDYADSHKNKLWQKYSAGAAASCMKSLLEQWAVVGQFGEEFEQQRGFSQKSHCPNPETVSEACTVATRSDEGYHSQYNPETGDEELLQVMQDIDYSFKCVLKSFREHRRYLPRDADLKKILKRQRFLISDHAKSLSSDHSTSVNERLGSSNPFCLEIAHEINKKLEGIEDLTIRLPAATKAKQQPKDAVTTLRYAVEDLRDLVQNLTSVLVQPRSSQTWECPRIAKTPGRRQKFEDSRVIRQAAYSLYEAMRTACIAHTVHNVQISLQPALDGRTTRVRFNFALIKHPKAPENTVWIDVDSTIKSPGSYSETDFISYPDAKLFLKRTREVERGTCSSAIRKRVQFKDPPAPMQPLCSKVDVVGIPNLHIQRNFCKVVERFLDHQEKNSCIGLLGDNETCKHLAYLASRTNMIQTATSLSEMISQPRSDITKEMSQFERVRLAKHLATAVLYFHSTPWLNKAWRSEDVHLFNRHGTTIDQSQHVIPYMTSSVSTESQQASPGYHRFIRNPVLFGLGVMFLELAFQRPLSSLTRSIDLREGGDSDFVEYFTARRVVEMSHSKISKSFKEVTKRCLYCDFGHDSDFTSPALQQAFYNKVIAVLDSLEDVYRDLQDD